jgi:FKBP-type peptidyl-prolyl cis-trans isomerase
MLLLLGTVALVGCLNNNDTGDGVPSDPATEKFADNLHINIAAMTKTAAGAYYKDAVVGTGAAVGGPVTVVISYKGYLTSGARFDFGETQTVALSSWVYGFQDGILGMRAGGERVIVIPSVLGFGSARVDVVPPNSTLIYDVSLEQVP